MAREGLSRGGERSFYSGRELEIDAFGKPKFGKEYENTYRQLAKEKGGYLAYNRAQELIKQFYPEDPTNPSKEFARDLRLAICEALELEGEDADAVKFYTAVGTALDLYHGVDAWVEIDLDDPSRGTLHAEATLDVTKRAEKLEEGHKADVIIGDVAAPDQKTYLPQVERYAEEVTELLFTRLQDAAQRKAMGGRR